MIETHYDPAEALVDGQQMITPEELKEVIDACRRVHRLVISTNK
jgi:3-deoxy-D-arabino-heptulosonate 7-phosphate (DAHP) synthase